MLVHHYFPKWADQVRKPAKILMMALLAVAFLIKMLAGESAGGAGMKPEEYLLIIPSALALNLACLLFGYFFLKAFGFDHATNLTASIESGVHNTTLAFLIAGTLLNNQEMVKPPLVYAMFSFWTALVWGLATSKLTNHQLDLS